MRKTLTTLSTVLMLTLSACGGGGPAPSQTATGFFIDSPVKGLSYTSGGQAGVTDADGRFIYEVGQPVTFSLGKLVLGSITVDKNNRIFPVDLVSGASDETHPKVSLMARVLQTLDSDNDPNNGITIDNQILQSFVEEIDLANDEPEDALAKIQKAFDDVPLVNDTTAESHIRANLLKEFAGTWKGNYSGGDQGPCTVVIDETGNVSGDCVSQGFNNESFTITGTLQSSGSSAAGNATTGANFTGTYQRYGEVTGDWENDKLMIKGTFALQRQTD